MIKKVFILLVAALFLSQTAYAAITKKKEIVSEKEHHYVYYDKSGSEIGREKIVKNSPAQFSPESKITGEVREVNDKGVLLYIWNYKDNKKDGKALGFYPGGQKMYELTYGSDVLKGIGIKYFENGNVSEKVFYVDGKVEGPAHIYLENGNYYKYNYINNRLNGTAHLYDKQHRLLEIATYKDNVLEGAYIKYYLSGAVKSEMKYSRGKLEGYARYYDEKGREVSTLLYKNGKEVDKIKHLEDGKKISVSQKTVFLKNKDAGGIQWQGPATIHLTESKKRVNEVKFFEKAKKLNGVYRTYYKNGQIRYEGTFVNNLPSGIFKTYSIEGNIVGVDNYSAGKLSGTSKMYYATGELLAEYRYKNGKIEGLSVVYNKDGSLISEVSYKNSLLHGSIKNFYENGNLCFESYFSNGEPVGQLRYYFSEKEHRLMYLIEFKDGRIHKSTAFSIDEFIEFTAGY